MSAFPGSDAARTLWARRRAGVVGGLAGALAGMLASELGVWGVTGGSGRQWTLMATVAGTIVALLGGELILLVTDVLVLTVYFVVAFSPLIVGPARRWVRDDSIPTRPVDAVVVLSGGVTGDTTLGAEAADRLLEGLELVQRGVAPLLVTTHVLDTLEFQRISSEPDQRRLVTLAGLENHWLNVDSVYTTRDEAVRISAALPSARAQRIVVVTSPMHTRRACAAFEEVGFTVSCVAARLRVFAARNPIGSYDRLQVFQSYLYERLGMIKYKARGWVR